MDAGPRVTAAGFGLDWPGPGPEPAMKTDHRTPRLYVEAALAAGAPVALPESPSHYLRAVLRAGPGDAVLVFNGRDGEYEAVIDRVSKRGVALRLGVRRRAPDDRGAPGARSSPWLLFAPVKKAALDIVIAKATELGVGELRPVTTRFTAVARVNIDRLRAQAIEAAEQSDRLSPPDIRPPVALDRAFDAWPAGRRLFVLDETGGGAPALAAFERAGPGPAAFLVGPEGGFHRSELDRLRDLPFATAIGLGPRILKADTAALAALACWMACHGDWDRRPAFRAPFPAGPA